MSQKNQETTNLNEYIITIVKRKNPQTVKQLVQLVKQEYLSSEEEILEHIIDLQNQGKLAFQKNTIRALLSPRRFFVSVYSMWYWVVVLLALATTVSIFTIPENAFPLALARYILASIFILFLPGYSFIKALFPVKELDNIERTALSVGMSLALVTILGLLLSSMQISIRTAPVTLSVLLLTAVFSTTAIVRQFQVVSKEHR